MNKLRVVLTTLLIALPFAGITPGQQVVTVAPGMDLQAVLETAPSHSVVELTSGVYDGPVTLDRTVTLTGPRGAVVTAPIDADAAVMISAPGVLVSGVTVRGGWTGIDLLSATGSTIRDVVVERADAQGIRVYRRQTTLERVEVRNLLDPYAQGIEVLSAPEVVVRDSIVRGGKFGIVAHLSTVRFERNVVSGTTGVAIMIREMGSGAAIGNRVTEAAGAGLYCGDMSRCEFADNEVSHVTAASNLRSSAGWGLVVHYRSTASTTGDRLEGAAGETVVLADSRIVDESPLRLGQGRDGIIAGVMAALVALLGLMVCFVVARLAVPKGGWGGPVVARLAGVATPILLVGLAVQSFHMVEHWLQLYRVRFQGVPSGGGLAGPAAEGEWVHLLYNAAVLAGFGTLLLLRKRGWLPPGRVVLGDRLLVAAFLLQSYHLVEHTLKVWQHTMTGTKVNPGFLGRYADLVLVHFGINAAVYLASVGICLIYLLRVRIRHHALRSIEPGAAGIV